MRWKKSRVIFLIAALLYMIIIAGYIPNMTVNAKTNIQINKKEITLQKGKIKQLSLLGISKKESKKIVWKSSKKSVISVNKRGLVKARKNGTAIISAEYKEKIYRCKINVIKKNNTRKTEENRKICISIGEKTLYANLDNSKIAQQFVTLLPQTISMQRIGDGREFYGDLDDELDYNEADSQTTFENGDIAYWYSGNGLCLLYNNQVKNPEIQSGIIVFGKITSDLSVFYDFDEDIEVTISLAK